MTRQQIRTPRGLGVLLRVEWWMYIDQDVDSGKASCELADTGGRGIAHEGHGTDMQLGL